MIYMYIITSKNPWRGKINDFITIDLTSMFTITLTLTFLAWVPLHVLYCPKMTILVEFWVVFKNKKGVVEIFQIILCLVMSGLVFDKSIV